MFVVRLFIATCGLDYIGDNHDGGADYKGDGGAFSSPANRQAGHRRLSQATYHHFLFH